jgi:hypothetical protein
MSPARRAFVRVFLVLLVLGFVIGLIKLIAPEVATVTLNGRDLTGWPAVATATGIGAVLGVVLGLIAAGLVAVFSRRRA